MKGRIEDLVGIAAILRDRDLGKVERVVAHMNRLSADIARLNDACAARAADLSLDTARLAGADVAWEAWTEAKLRRAQAQMATLRVSHEAALAEARGSFGRADVMRQIAEDEMAARRGG